MSAKQFQKIYGEKPCIGLALGSGAARGWAHIGVIRALNEMGIRPQMVAGTSMGAIVGAAYVSNNLDDLESWVLSLTWKKIIQLLDLSLLSGGVIQGEKLYNFVSTRVQDIDIESLSPGFGTVATDLNTGREVWFRDGPLLCAVRASIGLPGLLSPFKYDGKWLVDGGLTNPVPVSLCRAMGAEVIIAVNLNEEIVGKHGRNRQDLTYADKLDEISNAAFLERISLQLRSSLHERKDILLSRLFGEGRNSPGILEVLASSINIMQDRITRSRMAGDPPEIIISPRLSQLGLLEFDKADLAIEEGRIAVQRMSPALEQIL